MPTTIRSTAVRIVPDEQERPERAPRLGTDDERRDGEDGQQDHPAGLRQDAAVDPLAAGRPRARSRRNSRRSLRPPRAGPLFDRRPAGTRPARGRRCPRAGRPARCRARRGDESARSVARSAPSRRFRIRRSAASTGTPRSTNGAAGREQQQASGEDTDRNRCQRDRIRGYARGRSRRATTGSSPRTIAFLDR